MTGCDICEIVNDPKTIVYETKHWVVPLAKDQTYLGRCYVTLKRHCSSLADLTNTEWSELHRVMRLLELALKKTFGANMFNWTCLMNDAYRIKPYTPHLHWHFRPRYDQQVKFAGMTFADPEFGHHYSREHERSMIAPLSVRGKIVSLIRKNI